MNFFKTALASLLLVLVVLSSSCKSDKEDEVLSDENRILEFSLLDVAGTIDNESKTIKVFLPKGKYDLSQVAPKISISKEATISPSASTKQDFTKAVTYAVKSESGLVAKYTVSVEVAGSSTAKIISFAIVDGSRMHTGMIDEENKKIRVRVPFGTDINKMLPHKAEFIGASIVPTAVAVNNYVKQDVVFTVTAEDGTQKKYTVTVEEQKSSDAKLESYTLTAGGLDAEVVCVIDQDAKTIKADVPYKTDLTKLIPIAKFVGHTITPQSGKVQDMSKVKEVVIVAQDGTKVTYTLNINVIKGSEAKLIKLEMFGRVAEQPIDLFGKNVVKIQIPYQESNVLTARPKIEFVGGSISPASNAEIDFRNPVNYKITAEDGTTTYNFILSTDVESFKARIDKVTDKGVLIQGEGENGNYTVDMLGLFSDVKDTEVELRKVSDPKLKVFPKLNIDDKTRINFGLTDAPVQSGSYTIHIRSRKGLWTDYPTPIAVLSRQDATPAISNLSSTVLKSGDKLVITGTGFKTIETGAGRKNTTFYLIDSKGDTVPSFYSTMSLNDDGTRAQLTISLNNVAPGYYVLTAGSPYKGLPYSLGIPVTVVK